MADAGLPLLRPWQQNRKDLSSYGKSAPAYIYFRPPPLMELKRGSAPLKNTLLVDVRYHYPGGFCS